MSRVKLKSANFTISKLLILLMLAMKTESYIKYVQYIDLYHIYDLLTKYINFFRSGWACQVHSAYCFYHNNHGLVSFDF